MSNYLLEFSLAGASDWYRWPNPAVPLQEAVDLVRDLNAQGKGVVYRYVPVGRPLAAINAISAGRTPCNAERLAFEAEVTELFHPPICLQRHEGGGEYLDAGTRDLWLGWMLRACPATPTARKALGQELQAA